MSKEGLSELRGLLQGLLEFQAQNAFNHEDFLLFLGLLNVTMAMHLLQKRVRSEEGVSASPAPASAATPDPLTALGQLLTARGKGGGEGGGTSPLAGLLRDPNLPALLSTVAGLLKQSPVSRPGGGEPERQPARPAEAVDAVEQPADQAAERPAERSFPRPLGRREPLRWDFGKK